MKMHYRTSLLLLCAPLATACFQELDTGADRQAKETLGTPPPPPREHPSIIPFVAEPPLVTPSDNTPVSADDSCAATQLLVMDTLNAACSACHGPVGVASGGFSSILDVDFMTSHKPNNSSFNTINFITRGEPKKSAIYLRMFDESMPQPPSDVTNAAANNYRWPLNTSDFSLMYTWIKDCLK